ncbi:hypothetical protein JZ751_009902 [Albula glossodonta]|uniref:Uncharacterized protein n=1 Tax=Albula glossodonta TaxID=121402 RepID=A0A8T2NYD2_9TELE|nr:hypothetical protein JZ751_009902 [Albula glossodonta]
MESLMYCRWTLTSLSSASPSHRGFTEKNRSRDTPSTNTPEGKSGPQSGAVEQRGIKWEEGVTTPHKEREDQGRGEH